MQCDHTKGTLALVVLHMLRNSMLCTHQLHEGNAEDCFSNAVSLVLTTTIPPHSPATMHAPYGFCLALTQHLLGQVPIVVLAHMR